MNITSGGIFFYEIAIFAFIAVFSSLGGLRLKEWDSFCTKHLQRYLLIILFTVIPSFLILYVQTSNIINSLMFSSLVPLIVGIYKTSNRRKEQRKIEDFLSVLFLIPFFVSLIAYILVINFSFEIIVSGTFSFLIAIAIGVLFGIAVQGIPKDHIMILLTFSSIIFIISDSITRFPFVSIIVFGLLYYNFGRKKEIKYDIIFYFFKAILTLSLIEIVFVDFSIIALIIAVFAVIIRILFGFKHISYSLIPLSVAMGLDKLFFGTVYFVNVVAQVTLFIAMFGIIINAKDIFLRLKKELKHIKLK
ncbi:hypothetical protein JXM83_04080 [Candidatus Woesearchaeota archaeon]|nr:hypothetical protein [Candidatus Woesearchaeota archaeon]